LTDPFLPLTNVITTSGDPQVGLKHTYQNLDIWFISAVAFYPSDVHNTLASNTALSGFADIVRNTVVSMWDTGENATKDASIIEVLSGVRGLTLFAPENDAFFEQILQLPDNLDDATLFWDVFQNHIINGTTVYSPNFLNSSYVSAAGEEFYFTTNSTGSFVTSGNTTARITQPDVLTSNGVIHVIDRALANIDVNETAALDAYLSASSVAAHDTTDFPFPTGSPSAKFVNGAIGNLNGVNGFGVVALSVVLGYSFLFA
jgi:uncharacterized surface protein with fasciclin (FAS1) repeats